MYILLSKYQKVSIKYLSIQRVSIKYLSIKYSLIYSSRCIEIQCNCHIILLDKNSAYFQKHLFIFQYFNRKVLDYFLAVLLNICSL